MGLELSFGQVEAVLATMNHIAPDKRVAFMSRLKHLQKQGRRAAFGAGPGRGKAGSHSFRDFMYLVIGVELVQAGFPPLFAAKLVSGSWSVLSYSIYAATYTEEEMDEWQEMPLGPTTREWLWMISPEALRDLSEEGVGEWDHMEAIHPVPIEDAMSLLARGDPIGGYGEGWRITILNGTKITQAVVALLCQHFKYATPEDIRRELAHEQDDLSASLFMLTSPIEEVTLRHKGLRNQVLAAIGSQVQQPRFFPSEAVLARQAGKLAGRLKPHHIARLRVGQFPEGHVADVMAINDFLGWALLIPELRADDGGDTFDYQLTPLGQAVTRAVEDVEVPSDAIEADRAEKDAELWDAKHRRIAALLANDPDLSAEDPVIEHWALHGGTMPASPKKRAATAARLRAAADKDPDFKDALQDMAQRMQPTEEAEDGDSQ